MNYSIAEHRWRFAAWTASTAGRSSPKCRFSVERGTKIMEKSKCRELAKGWNALPTALEFDGFHRELCSSLVNEAELDGLEGFSYGIAAKLLNVFLKTLFVAGCDDHLTQERLAKQSAIHPPIDRVLLGALERKNIGDFRDVWRSHKNAGWSTFDEMQYSDVINHIKMDCDSAPLWTIESYWKGFQ